MALYTGGLFAGGVNVIVTDCFKRYIRLKSEIPRRGG